ncbi:MAG: hypothetical protein ACOYVF_10805, partial [Candidatus Zixiibacteriota bacterium]
LYSEMALLIGTFMLGLALGTYVFSRIKSPRADIVTLSLLFLISVMFLLTYWKIPASILLLYHSLFLFLTAVGTGGLFVAASQRYYAKERIPNRGTGYAWELIGSATGAFLTVTVLLPVIGIDRLFFAIVVLLATTAIGCLWHRR